jgi:hypothetical protein
VTTSEINGFVKGLIGMGETILMFDISNLLHRTFYANKTMDDQTAAGLAQHQALTTLNKYYKIYNPTKVIMTYDRSNWRKAYTKTDKCLSGKVYKGHRRKDLTPGEKARYEKFCEHLAEFEELMRTHTSVICLGKDKLEADDLMAGVVQRYAKSGEEVEVIIVSQDKDLMQLLKHDFVRLVDPATGKERNLSEYNNDADLFLYEKYIRGDTGDNVGSAYPRVRKTRIHAAYNDAYEHEKMMNETWTNQDGVEFIVKDLFEENKLLMGLDSQPDHIRDLIFDTIDEEFEDPGKYSHFHFLRFCGKYELKNISNNIDRYRDMLSC